MCIRDRCVALALADTRVREGDRLRVRVRVFEGTIDTEVRVMSTRGGDTAGTIVAGCAFLSPRRMRARSSPDCWPG